MPCDSRHSTAFIQPAPGTVGPVMRTLRPIVAAFGLAAVLLAGCGDDDGGDDGAAGTVSETTQAPESSETSAPEGADGGDDSDGPAGAAAVEIPEFAFAPDDLTVAAGTDVSVTNSHTQPHTLTSSEGGFNTGNIDPDQTQTFTAPSEPGAYAFICSYHPFMTGTLTVE